VVFFSLGVEKGKRIAVVKEQKPTAEKAATEEVVVEEKLQPVVKPLTKPLAKPIEAPKQIMAAPKVVSNYVIQVASYKDNKQAEDESNALAKKGYKSEVARSGNYSVVYITGFANKEQAVEVLKNIKPTYRDCFIKKRY
jgi:cell division protein FtsN